MSKWWGKVGLRHTTRGASDSPPHRPSSGHSANEPCIAAGASASHYWSLVPALISSEFAWKALFMHLRLGESAEAHTLRVTLFNRCCHRHRGSKWIRFQTWAPPRTPISNFDSNQQANHWRLLAEIYLPTELKFPFSIVVAWYFESFFPKMIINACMQNKNRRTVMFS